MSDQPEVDYEESQVPIAILKIHVPNIKEPIIAEALATDNILEIRHFLYETGETCHLTSFHLEYNGETLNDFADVSEYPDLLSTPEEPRPCDVYLVLDNYDDRTAKDHFQKFRDTLVRPPPFNKHLNFLEEIISTKSVADDFKTRLANAKKHLTQKKSRKALTDANKQSEVETFSEMTFDEFNAPTMPEVPRCLVNVVFSVWNPVPSHRKLKGDLFYIDVTTLDNKFLCVTASKKGFFVNQSTQSVFNPTIVRDVIMCHSLRDILCVASHSFATGWAHLTSRKTPCHPLETQNTVVKAHAWMAVPTQHTPDWISADAANHNLLGHDPRVPHRDWNLELIQTQALSKSQPQHRLLRDRALGRFMNSFNDFVVAGATAAVDGSLFPMNPNEPEYTHLYLSNNIFFSTAADCRNLFPNAGGSTTVHAAVKVDLEAVNAVMNLDLAKVNPLATLVVDYQGQRIVGQSLIPGIFSGSTTHVYGSMDNVFVNTLGEDCLDEIKKIGDYFHIKPTVHKHTDAEGVEKETQLYTGGYVVGMQGSDNNLYLTELHHLLPRDVNFPEVTDLSCVMRLELVQQYCRSKAFNEAIATIKADEKPEADKDAEKDAELTPEEADKKKAEESAKTDALNKQRREQYFSALYKYKFNTVLHTPQENTLVISDEEKAADEALLQDLATYLKDEVIGNLVKSLDMGVPVEDGKTFVELLEKKGVPARYLGYITQECEKKGDELNYPKVVKFLQLEMISRAMKTVVSDIIRHYNSQWFTDDKIASVADLIAVVLNGLFGKAGAGANVTTDVMTTAIELVKQQINNVIEVEKSQIADSTQSLRSGAPRLPALPTVTSAEGITVEGNLLSPTLLWAAVVNMVKTKYRYDLPTISIDAAQKLRVLRSLAKYVGIELVAKVYDLTTVAPFTDADVSSLKPIPHALHIESKDARDALDSGKSHLSQGLMDHASAYFQEACNLFMQTEGTLSVALAELYTMLAPLTMNAGDAENAIEFIYRALVIVKKKFGNDHPYTAALLVQLSYFLVCIDRPLAAVKYLRQALYIASFNTGAQSPDTITCLLNIVLVYAEGGEATKSLQLLQQLIKRSVAFTGTQQHPLVSRLYEIAGFIHYSQGSFLKALEQQKIAYDITLELVKDMEEDMKVKRLNLVIPVLNQYATSAQLEANKAKSAEYQAEVVKAKQALGSHAFASLYWSDLKSMSSDNVLSVENMLKLLETNEMMAQSNAGGEKFIPYSLGASQTVYKKK